MFDAALAQRPQNAKALLSRGLSFYKENQLELALEDFHQATETPDAPPRAHHLAAMVAYRLNKDDYALATTKQGLARYPDYGPMHYLRALVLMRQDRPKDALTAIERAIDLGQRSGELYLARATLRSKLGDHEGARADYALADQLFSKPEIDR